jgi:hypothetical protein
LIRKNYDLYVSPYSLPCKIAAECGANILVSEVYCVNPSAWIPDKSIEAKTSPLESVICASLLDMSNDVSFSSILDEQA